MGQLEQLRSSGLFEARAPRYTSYPPVDRFQVAEGRLHRQSWLKAVPDGASVALYIHVPYCLKMCWFCACRTQALEGPGVLETYLKALRSEIREVRTQLPDKVFLSRLHLGGGTPTLLDPAMMENLLASVFGAFPKTDKFEFAVEVDSTQLSDAQIPALIRLGMTRAIVGVQDFDPDVQHAIGRAQSFEQTLTVVRRLRRHGLKHLDMEMLHGLPIQTTASIAETTQQVLSLEPDRIAICEYAHMPTVAKRQILLDARKLPPPEEAFHMFQVARQIVLSDGYQSIGMDHFVRPKDSLVAARAANTLRRDFQGYSDNTASATIGLGASAISRFPQGYVQNNSATSIYLKNVLAGGSSANRGYCLTATDKIIASAIESLMCRFQLSVGDIESKHPKAEALVMLGLEGIAKIYAPYVEKSGGTIKIKPDAHPLVRVMSETFDRLARSDGPP